MADVAKRYGEFEILEALGQGGMGVVYRARNVATGDWVALKTVRVPSEDVVQTIRREIRALARARHSGIARIVAEGQQAGLPWYAMELFEGTTLRHRVKTWFPTRSTHALANDDEQPWWTDRLAPEVVSEALESARRGPRISTLTRPDERRRHAAGGHLDDAIRLALALCEPLAFLHGEGIVHCDLKPDNIMLRGNTEPVLVDFGLTAKFWSHLTREELDLTTMSTGTLAYMAPEQIRGELVDPRTDLYALGCILYLMVTGRTPFEATDISELALKHLETSPRPASELVDGVPRELDLLLLDLLAKDPRKRTGYADDVAMRLAALLGPRRPVLSYRPYVYRPRFVDRANLVDALEDRLTDVHHNRGSVMLVLGPSGSGKTRFLAEVAGRARNRGMQVFGGACSPVGPGGGSAPLFTFQRVLQQTALRCQQLGPRQAQRTFGPHGRVLAAFEPSIGALAGLETTSSVELDPEAARDRVFQSLAWTLGSVAVEKPMLFIIDDVQWADELSLTFLEYLLRSDALSALPAVFLCTVRTDEPGASLMRLELAQKIELPRLDREAIAVMIGDMLAIETVPEAMVSFIEARAHGTPFVITEMIRTAVEQGVIKRGLVDGTIEAEGSRWQLEDGTALDKVDAATLPLPHSLEGLLRRRLEALIGAAAAMTEALAVAGPQLPIPLLSEMLEADDAETSAALDNLLSAHVIERAPKSHAVRFVNEQLWQLAHETLDGSQRRKWHRRAALVMEQHPGLLPSGVSATIAEHWRQAGDAARASAYYVRAAREAAASYKLETAETLYRTWLALESDAALRVEARLELAEILRVTGQWAEARRLLEAALQAAREMGNKTRLAQSEERLGSLLNVCGEHDTALVHLRVARRMWSRMKETGRLGRTLGEIGQVLRRRGDFGGAETHFRRQMEVAQGLERADQVVQAHMNLGRLSLQRGASQDALDSFAAAQQLTTEHGLQQLRCVVLGDVGDAHLQTGEHTTAVAAYEEQLAAAALMGDRQSAASAVRQIGVAHWRHGHPRQALVCFAGSLKVALELGDLTAVAVTLARVADVDTVDGHYERADRAYSVAIDLMRRAALRYYLSSALYRRAEVQLHLAELPGDGGDVDLTYALLHEAREVARAISRSCIELAAQTLILILDVQTGDKATDDAVKRLSHQLSSAQHPLDRAAILWALWRVDPTDARRQAAAAAYRDPAGRISATARLRYAALTGQALGTPEFDTLPPTLKKVGISVDELIAHSAAWF